MHTLQRFNMESLLLTFCIAFCVVLVEGRGPLCLSCDLLPSPALCRSIVECKPSESCFSEHIEQPDGAQAFSFGCRLSQFCTNGIGKRSGVPLCAQCCTGDLCNNNICTNGTEPPAGIPCLLCSDVPVTSECTAFTYCPSGQVCYSQRSLHNMYHTMDMGCLRKQTCSHFNAEIIGKREVGHSCHACCESPGCNHDACGDLQTTRVPHLTVSSTTARDCWDIRSSHRIAAVDGVYEVLAPNGKHVQVYCDMTTDGGGWIVFQKRFDGTVDFNQTYSNYSAGFGDLSTEFWLGNEHLYQFTQAVNQTLRVDLCGWDDSGLFAVYEDFRVGPPSDDFRLRVAGYHGDASDALSFHNGQRFSTYDRDNNKASVNCGVTQQSGWWFNNCYGVNLNAVYSLNGMRWNYFSPGQLRAKGSEMKFRPSYVVTKSNDVFKCPVN